MRQRNPKTEPSLGVAARRILRLAGTADSLAQAAEIVTGHLLEGLAFPPVDLAQLSARMNVIACKEADIPVNGELHRAGGAYEVYYSSQLTPARRRFTIAHELGHVILDSTGPRCPQSGEEVERICDMLATALLLPRAAFMEAFRHDRTPDAILAAARLFEVSITAAAIRYAMLFRYSVFEVEDGKVLWGHGTIKRGFVTSDIKPAVDKAMSGISGEEKMVLNNGRQARLQWATMGNRKRALFVVAPATFEINQ